MNKKQKIIIGVGLGLILLSGLFPAYEGEWRRDGDNLKRHLGNYFIFSPPNSSDVYKAFYGKLPVLERSSIFFNANIIVSQCFVQIVTILLLTIGLENLFAGPKHENKSPINKKEI